MNASSCRRSGSTAIGLHGIPSSKVVACDTSGRVIDRDLYMLVDISPVFPFDDSVPKGEKTVCMNRLADMPLAQITGPAFGRLARRKAIPHGTTFTGGDRAAGTGMPALLDIFKGEISQIMEILWKYRAFWGKVEIPPFVHMDLWDGNILVQPSPEGDGFQIAAIIDGDRALYGDPDYDFSTPWISREAFFRGAGREKPDPAEPGEKAMIYQMLIAASDAYICQVEYNNRRATRIRKSTGFYSKLNKWKRASQERTCMEKLTLRLQFCLTGRTITGASFGVWVAAQFMAERITFLTLWSIWYLKGLPWTFADFVKWTASGDR
ncbi:MAG: phosphotransferase family protein [[Clostridium] leptum]